MNKQNGFTLVEISIVLVVIGLLAGGILKAQELIDNMKYKAWVKEANGYHAAIYAFQDRYKYLPGDFPRASTAFPQITGIINGNGNGLVDSTNWTTCTGFQANCEFYVVFQHLMAAGLIKGDIAVTGLPRVATPVGGYTAAIVHQQWTSNRLSIYLQYGEIPTRFAKRIDQEFDDGKGNSGNIVCTYFCGAGNDWPSDSSVANVMIGL